MRFLIASCSTASKDLPGRPTSLNAANPPEGARNPTTGRGLLPSATRFTAATRRRKMPSSASHFANSGEEESFEASSLKSASPCDTSTAGGFGGGGACVPASDSGEGATDAVLWLSFQ